MEINDENFSDNQRAIWHDVIERFIDVEDSSEQRTTPNMFAISGFPDSEIVSSNVLAFFLDPETGHGLGDLVLRSLVAEIQKRANDPDIFSDLDFSSCTVTTEHATANGNRIDILIEFEDSAIIIENKVNAILYNPLDDYQNDVRNNGYSNVPVVVLHQHDQPIIHDKCYCGLKLGHDLFDIPYRDFFDRVLDGLGHAGVNADLRCLDILQQFIDNYSDQRIDEIMKTRDTAIANYMELSNGVEDNVYNVISSYRNYEKNCIDKMNEIQDAILQIIPDSMQFLQIEDYCADLNKHWSFHLKSFPTFRAFRYQIKNLTDGTDWYVTIEICMHEPHHKENRMLSTGVIWFKAYWETEPIPENLQKTQSILKPFYQCLNSKISDDLDTIVDEIIKRTHEALELAVHQAITKGFPDGTKPNASPQVEN